MKLQNYNNNLNTRSFYFRLYLFKKGGLLSVTFRTVSRSVERYFFRQTQNPVKVQNRCFRTIWLERKKGLIQPDRELKECFLPLLKIFTFPILLISNEL